MELRGAAGRRAGVAALARGRGRRLVRPFVAAALRAAGVFARRGRRVGKLGRAADIRDPCAEAPRHPRREDEGSEHAIGAGETHSGKSARGLPEVSRVPREAKGEPPNSGENPMRRSDRRSTLREQRRRPGEGRRRRDRQRTGLELGQRFGSVDLRRSSSSRIVSLSLSIRSSSRRMRSSVVLVGATGVPGIALPGITNVKVRPDPPGAGAK
jgi:hypothetical protein